MCDADSGSGPVSWSYTRCRVAGVKLSDPFRVGHTRFENRLRFRDDCRVFTHAIDRLADADVVQRTEIVDRGIISPMGSWPSVVVSIKPGRSIFSPATAASRRAVSAAASATAIRDRNDCSSAAAAAEPPSFLFKW